MTSAEGASSPGVRIVMYVEARSYGGALAVLGSLADGMRGRYDVRVICCDDPALTSYTKGLVSRGIRVERDALANREQLGGWFELTSLFRIFRIVRDADLVHFHLHTPFACLPVIFMARLMQKKIVTTEHALGVLLHLRRRQLPGILSAVRELRIAVQMFLKRLSLRCIDTIVTVSRANADFLQTALPGITPHVLIIPNGIDPAPFEKEPGHGTAALQELGIPVHPAPPIVTVIAALNNAKGHEYLLRAMPGILQRIPGTMLVLAGDGHILNELKRLAGELSISSHVIFAGNRDNIPDLLAATDVVVLPSLFESMPLSLQEAMAAAKPVVASDVGGIPELVCDNETGFLVPPRNSDRLASQIIRLLEDPALRVQFGLRGRERVHTHFHRQQMIERYSALYESLCMKVKRPDADHPV